LGEETADVIQHGGLVSDKIIIGLIEDWLRLHGGHGFVFDGFPRTLLQAESLMSILARLRTALDLAIWLEVSEQTVRDRISGRLQCGSCGFTTSVKSAKFAERPVCPYCDGPLVRRSDDDVTVLQKRLSEFETKTQPLASFYQKTSILHRIDGNRDREAVFADISRLIEDKKAPA
jgi:adenylate kinase